jgi:DNA-binding XRE family transcriptional regulator
MQVVAKTPHIDIRICGDIPEKIFRALQEEYGDLLQSIPEQDDEAIDVFHTEWYEKTKNTTSPGEALRIYRKNAGLTQAALGNKIGGVPRQHISGMETGQRSISKEMAKKLATVLQTSPARFLGI